MVRFRKSGVVLYDYDDAISESLITDRAFS